MAFKPNYRHERAERNRAKEQKKQEKLLRRQNIVAQRKAGEEAPPRALEDEPKND